jgi:hypothetical protein
MLKEKPNSLTSPTQPDRFRTSGSHMNLSNLYVAHETEPIEHQAIIRRFRFEPISGSFWESRTILRRRILRQKHDKLLN